MSNADKVKDLMIELNLNHRELAQIENFCRRLINIMNTKEE